MESNQKPRILAVVGPTASGKTSLSIALAQHYRGEILSCDSMQIYRGMDIGTATPTLEEQAGIPHHFINELDPTQPYSCADFVRMARETVAALTARGILPIFCGGTGLYLDGFLMGGSYESTPADPAVRARLNEIAATPEGAAELHRRLCEIDPESGAAIHPNNVKRVVRALEIYECCGKTKTELDRASRLAPMPYDACVIGLRYHSRELLYSRIDRRVDEMMELGLWEEIVRLEREGIFERSPTAAQAIGYKELLGALRGEITLEQAIDTLKLATRHYAKRQMTWFSAKPYVRWIFADTEQGSMRPFADMFSEALTLTGQQSEVDA